jgi:antitoxin HicB
MVDRAKKLPARFYVSPGGSTPVREWLLALTDADRRLIGKDIQKVEFGWPIGRPHRAPLSHGLWEVRSHLDHNRIAGDLLHRWRSDDSAARLHKEDPEARTFGHRSGPQAQTRGDMMSAKKKKKASISEETFDEFLAGQGILEACEDHAIKEIIAEQLAAAMREQGITKSEMAARMKTSRRQLDRLLDPSVPSVTLDTLRRAATAVGRTLRVELV